MKATATPQGALVVHTPQPPAANEMILTGFEVAKTPVQIGAVRAASMANIVFYRNISRVTHQKYDEKLREMERVKVECDLKLGQILKSTPRAVGAQGVGKSGVPDGNTTPTLDDLGLTRKESMNLQRLASLSEDEVEQIRTGASTLAKILAARQPKPEKEAPIPEVEVLRLEVARLQLALDNEESTNLAMHKDYGLMKVDLDSMAKTFESNEPLKAALAEAAQARQMNSVLNDRVAGLQREKNDLLRANNGLKSKVKKLEEALKSAVVVEQA